MTKTKNLSNLKSKLIKNHKHVISIAITVIFTAIAIFCFPEAFTRFLESLRDLGISFVNYFIVILGYEPIRVPVNEPSQISLIDLGILPGNWDLFLIKLELWWLSLFNLQTLDAYGILLSETLYNVCYGILLVIPFVLVLILIGYIEFKKTSTDEEDTENLKRVKNFSKKYYIPLKSWVKDYIGFVKERKAYYIIWLCQWLFMCNVGAIIIEFVAYYLYLISTFDLTTLYMQFYKLVIDLALPITRIPAFIWAVIGIIVFDLWRNAHARNKREDIETTDEEIAQGLPVASLITGAMNTKKTTSGTDLALTFNKIFRDVALKKLIANDMKFPHFPWIRLERCIKYGMDKHTIYNLATARRFVRQLKAVYYRGNCYPNLKNTFLNALKYNYGYCYKDFLFEYDFERYGFNYYDQLELQTIFDVLETYAQLYFIYVIQTSFIISSYSIRVDDFKEDIGNFPLWNIDFFRDDLKEIEKYTRRSHIIDFDALRLGKRMLANNKFANSLDFGIIVVTEIGKERGNQNTLQGVKQSAATANQKNDLFTIDVKMCRHRATVDNYPFVVFIMDEQRAASLNADTSELCDILYIADSTDFKFITPVFALDELVWMGATKLFNLYYPKDRHNKANNSLFRHVIKCFYNLVNRHYIKIFNRYTASTLTFSAHKGAETETKTKKYKLLKKKIHAGRFSTDAFAAFYYVKTSRSEYGINDLPEFTGKTATFEELNKENSYFVKSVNQAFINDSYNDE